MSDFQQGPGWWYASDGKWYPPAAAPRPPAYQSKAEEIYVKSQTARAVGVLIGFALALVIVVWLVSSMD